MNDTTNAPVRRRKSSGARKAVIAAVVVAMAGGGWYGWHRYKASLSKEGEYMTSPITRGDIEDLVTSTGTLQPRDYVDVGAQVSGQIEKLYVEVGDVVKKGDKLAEIDATTSEAKMEATRANLASAENSLLTQIENLEKSKRDVERQRNLYAQDATTKQSLLDAETSYNNALRTKTNQELTIKTQKANMRIDEKNLAFTSITAPIDGTVMKISVKEGQTVNASQNVPNVMQIANLSTMTVQSEVSEADVAKLYKGISVYFTTLGGNNRRWYGELKRIEPTPKVQNSVVLYNALFDVTNDGGNLMPQMTAQVYFVSAEAKDVVMVPMAAIQQGQQIQRELAQKERDKKGGAAGAAGGPPGGMPGATAGATGAAPAAAPAAATAPGAGREGAPAVAANTAAPGAGAAPAATTPGQGGQGGRGAGGGFNGPRPGGANGPGGFNPQNMTPEQLSRMRGQSGGFQGGQRGGNGGQRGGNFGGQRQGGAGNFNAVTAGGTAGPRPAQRRNGTVMIKKADGTLEARKIVYGVTNRVQAQVLEGLKEGEEVVVGKREAAAKPGSASQPQTQPQQGNRGGGGGGFSGGGGGGFPGGGGGGGGGRPF